MNSPLLSICMYHLGNKQYARRWPQFRDTVHPIDTNNMNNVLKFSKCRKKIAGSERNDKRETRGLLLYPDE
jgi:hypothetical protein